MEGLSGVGRQYAWGDPTFIPDLLGAEPDGTPQAELWFGAHPSGPSTLGDRGVTLDRAVTDDPLGVVGHAEGTTFPFLVKILAAAAPLSIQVHPDADQAREGFAREDAAGIPRDAVDRTYRDPFPKPELICALTPFSAKCGLRPVRGTLDLLALLDVDGLTPLQAILSGAPGTGSAEEDDRHRLRAAIGWLFAEVGPDLARSLVDQVVDAVRSITDPGPYEDVLAWTVRIATCYPGDVGVVVSLLLNHVELMPGEALFLGAGNLHSYLAGAAVEIMAPSDNVVRGGLTGKHVDTVELLRILDPSPIDPVVQRTSGAVHRYDVPAASFGLSRVELAPEPAVVGCGPGILIVVDGEAILHTASATRQATPSDAVFVPAVDGQVSLSGSGLAFWADAPR